MFDRIELTPAQRIAIQSTVQLLEQSLREIEAWLVPLPPSIIFVETSRFSPEEIDRLRQAVEQFRTELNAFANAVGVEAQPRNPRQLANLALMRVSDYLNGIQPTALRRYGPVVPSRMEEYSRMLDGLFAIARQMQRVVRREQDAADSSEDKAPDSPGQAASR